MGSAAGEGRIMVGGFRLVSSLPRQSISYGQVTPAEKLVSFSYLASTFSRPLFAASVLLPPASTQGIL